MAETILRTGEVSRRRFLTASAVAALAAPVIIRPGRARAAGEPIKVGFVTPKTGPLAFFGEPDDFVLAHFEAALHAGVDGVPIEIVVKDTQSNPSRAAELAAQLILDDEVSLLIAGGGPDTVNPVADQAEVNGVPCLCNASPWQSFVLGRNGTPDKGFEYGFLFAFGLEDIAAAYLALWSTLETNRKVGLILPNDADGNAWGDADFGFPPMLTAAGYEVVDSGRYTPMADDFSAQIAAFKAAGVDIVMGTMLPPEFASFWAQAAQQGLRPKVVTIGKTLLLPTTVEAIGARADGLSTEIAWTPAYPFQSGTGGITAGALAEEWEAATGRQWTQPLGLRHALIDVTIDVLRRAGKGADRDAVVAAIRSTDTETVLGPVNWSTSPIANVAKTPVVAGQWLKSGERFDLSIGANPTTLPIPVQAPLRALT